APGEIAMVGDSVGDLAMVPAAGGALAVGVLTGPARAEDLAGHADHILASIADLPGLLTRLA
ncbi:MAG: HAD hydrolase-like protein, partial [Pseudomonadota bacterium]